MCVGQSVCVTALRVCVLRGWRGNNILCVTDRSEINTDDTHTPADKAYADPQSDTPLGTMTSHSDVDSCVEADAEREVNQSLTLTSQSAVRVKQSRVINYQVKCK